jgi:tetratricopeptide (TPR) repeat protein
LYLATVRWTNQEIQESFLSLKRAFELDPNNVSVLWYISVWAPEFGQLEIADTCVKRMEELDPLSPLTPFSRGWYWLFGEGRPDLAVEPLRKAYEMSPGSGFYAFKYARALASTGQINEACTVIDHIGETGDDLWVWVSPFFKYALRNDREKAFETMTPERRITALKDPTVAWHLASGYALLGENELALDCLETSVEKGFINYPLFSELDPLISGIRHEPRFQRLMEKTRRIWGAFPEHPKPS